MVAREIAMHEVSILVFPGFEPLDLSGPASVFAATNRLLRRIGRPEAYRIEAVSAWGGPVESLDGIRQETKALSQEVVLESGTLLVAGGYAEEVDAAIAAEPVRRLLPLCAQRTGRFGSVCAGAFLLAASGVLDGRRVATHWGRCEELGRRHPEIQVDAEALYVVDGNVWTSAGVTAGIDMALAMVAKDVGPAIAGLVAKVLVVYARRPGHQSQFSPVLRAQLRAESPFAELVDWIHAHLASSLEVATLAERCALTERTFHRRFLRATGMTPGAFVESARLDAARLMLGRGANVKSVAAEVGMSTTRRFAEAFQRRFGISPSLYQRLHADP